MSFAEPQQPRARRAVPLAPLLDIMFLLLIFFVVTSSFRAAEQQLDVQLPSSEAAEQAEPSRTETVVNVKADGTITIGSQTYTLPELRRLLDELHNDFPDERVVIRGDKSAVYERIVAVMDAARSVGIRNIYFATVKQAEQVEG